MCQEVYDPQRHGIDTQLASANWPMAQSGVVSAPPQTVTLLRRPKRNKGVKEQRTQNKGVKS